MSDYLNEFYEIPTTCVSDALNGMSNLDSSIKPVKESYKLVGRAFTVDMPIGDNQIIFEAIKKASPENVLVIDAKGDTQNAIAGDFILEMAKSLGIRGVIADGVVRDLEGIKSLDFPVFCKGTTVAASKKVGNGKINSNISCGGIPVNNGDLIIGDVDGVVVIPQDLEESVFEKSLEKLNQDQQREEKVSSNIQEINRYLDNKIQNNK